MNTKYMWRLTLLVLVSVNGVMATSSNSSNGIGNSSNTGDICMAGTWCSDGSVTDCPTYSSSLAGSTEITACVCDRGYTGENGTTCTACQMNSYKHMNGSGACDLCPVNTSSPPASHQLADCINSVATPTPNTTPLPGNTTVNFIDIKVDLFGFVQLSMWLLALVSLVILLVFCCCITFLCMCVGGTYKIIAGPTASRMNHTHENGAFQPCMIELGQGRMREMHLSMDSFVNPTAYTHLEEV